MGIKSKRAQELQKQYLINKDNKNNNNNRFIVHKKYIKKTINHLERLKHQSWCFKNDIIIYFKPHNYKGGNIIIEKQGEIIIYPGFYVQYKLKKNDVRYWDIVWELYTRYYEEGNKTN